MIERQLCSGDSGSWTWTVPLDSFVIGYLKWKSTYIYFKQIKKDRNCLISNPDDYVISGFVKLLIYIIISIV